MINDQHSSEQTLASQPSPSSKSPIGGLMARLVSGIGEGMLLVMLTCLSYGVAYNYKLGLYSGYGLPGQLVSVDLNDCLRAGGAVFSSLFVVMSMVNLPFMALNLVKFKKNWIRYLFLASILLFTVYSILKTLFGISSTSFLIGLSIIGGLALIAWLAAIWLSKYKSNGFETNGIPDIYQIAEKRLGAELFIFLMLLPAVGLYAEKLGSANAEKQKQFFQVSETKLVLIDSCPNGIICKTLQSDEGKLMDGFTLLRDDETKGVTFSPITIASWKDGHRREKETQPSNVGSTSEAKDASNQRPDSGEARSPELLFNKDDKISPPPEQDSPDQKQQMSSDGNNLPAHNK